MGHILRPFRRATFNGCFVEIVELDASQDGRLADIRRGICETRAERVCEILDEVGDAQIAH